MPRKTRSKESRRWRTCEQERREEEYRVLADQLHKEWCTRLDKVDIVDVEEILADREREGWE